MVAGVRALPRLIRLTSGDVADLVLRSLPRILADEPEVVAYVPRGGSIPAALIAQYANLPLTIDPAEYAGRRVLLVEDLCVTGQSLRRTRAEFQVANSVITYSLVRVSINVGFRPDYWSVSSGVDQYVMLPWEVIDMFDEDFPYRVVAEVDGVLRDPESDSRLLRADHVAEAATTGAAALHDADWAAAVGLTVGRWRVLDGAVSARPWNRPALYLCRERPDARHRDAVLSEFDVVYPLSEGSLEGYGYDRYDGLEES